MRLSAGDPASLPQAFLAHRVFFADEATARAAGYRPCGSCLRQQYLVWKAAQEPPTRP